jgi:ComF family protein
MLNDFFSLIFPRLCESCGSVLFKREVSLCTSCKIKLPKTDYHLDLENPLNAIFWGRVDVKMVAAYYRFSKGSKVQKLLHQLKYKGNQKIGEVIGEMYGVDLNKSVHFTSIDFIVPVPLHPARFKERGYNQSECFANGLGISMEIPVITNELVRIKDSTTQTKKSRFRRWRNVEDIFSLKEHGCLMGKTILLVDDVITTGATIEAAASVLLCAGCKVYVVVIACA